ncbi:MAG: hypothetical protein EHM34_04925 [Nitrosopumilales archaeon]|nr:MAG: hypothetical protein EHM34_04925 [Nitrosopumilales archaeon]
MSRKVCFVDDGQAGTCINFENEGDCNNCSYNDEPHKKWVNELNNEKMRFDNKKFEEFLVEKIRSIRFNTQDRSYDDVQPCKIGYECSKSEGYLMDEIIQEYKECGGNIDV